MSQEVLFRCCGLCMVGLVACLLLRQVRSELSSFVRVAAVVLCVGMLLPVFGELRTALDDLIGLSGIRPYADVMIKALGISLLCKICCDVCRDAGESSLGGGVELAGKMTILLLCVPLVGQILDYASQLLGRT